MAETIELILLGVSGLGALVVTSMALLSGRPSRSREDRLKLDSVIVNDLNSLFYKTDLIELRTLELSKDWIENLYLEIKSRSEIWITPHLTVQDGGDIVFEWWYYKRSLTVYVSADEVWFLQSAGARSDQTDGDANTPEVRRSIWQWLMD